MKNVERYYDTLAPIYDRATCGELAWMAPTSAYSLILPKAKSGSEVLDIGFGTGQTIERFEALGCSISGVDISDRMLDTAKSKFPKAHLLKCDLDIDPLPFPDAHFQIITAIGVFEFIKNLEAVLHEAHRVLLKGGHLCFSVELLIPNHQLQSEKESPCGINVTNPDDPSNFSTFRYSNAEIAKLMAQTNFTIISSSNSLGYYKTQNLIPIQYGYYLVIK